MIEFITSLIMFLLKLITGTFIVIIFGMIVMFILVFVLLKISTLVKNND